MSHLQNDELNNTTSNSAVINGDMPIAQILEHLTEHGCKDVSAHLDQHWFGLLPVSTGGAGNIYEGRLIDQTKVAIKCLRLRIGSSDESRKDLRRAAHELYVWSKCQHPNILELTGVATFHGQIAMVSPWMEKGTVTWFVYQNPQVDRYSLCVQIGEGVAYLHNNNIVHGDLKGANILVSDDGTLKITDFGTASVSKYTLKFHQTTGLPGMTLRWAAPELVKGESEHTTQADVYALGMTFLEVITGSEPYRGITEHAIMWKIVNGIQPARPAEHMPEGVIHDRMWSLLKACWTYSPQYRPTASRALDLMNPASPREPDYESIGDVLYVLSTFGYRDYTSMLETSNIVPIDEKTIDYEVFRAHIQDLAGGPTSYTFKCPKDSYFKDRSMAIRYTLRDLYIWSKCGHPNILKLFGVAECLGSLAVIYPSSFQLYFSYLTSHPNTDRLQVCIQVEDVIAYLHSTGIIHGNLTVGQVLVSDNGAVLFKDFSNAVFESTQPLFPRDPLLEPYYCQACDAPERFSYQKVPTREVDVWTLGLVMGSIITGRLSSALGIKPGPEYSSMPKQPTLELFQSPRGKRLWALIRACRRLDPRDRPTATKLLAKLKAIADMPSSQDQSGGWTL